jgi:dihydropyrimidinase
LQVVASGNCTFSRAKKEANKSDFTKVPNGVNGSEDRMKVIWEKCVATNVIDVQKFVAITSTNAAKIFNLYPRKGSVTVGADADLVIWNHQANETISAASHRHATDYNIFEGMKVSGAPEFVIVKGKVCYEDGNVRVAEGYGQFLELPTHCPLVYAAKTENGNGNGNGDHVDSAMKELEDELDQFQVEFEDRDYVPGRADSHHSTSTQVTQHTARAPRAEGVRDQQQSSFSISREIDNGPKKSSIRVRNPPGGASSGLW